MHFNVYGKTVCPNCKKAVDLLESKGYSYTYTNLEEDINKFFELKSKGVRQVPYITVDNEEIGSYNNLVKYLNDI